MMRLIPVLALALATSAPLAAASRTVIAAPVAQPGWFLCDAIDGPAAYLVGERKAASVAIVQVPLRGGRLVTRNLAVGDGDAGMGQIHYPLRDGVREVGDLHLVNPGMIGSPAVVMTVPATSVTLDGKSVQCRWLAGTRFAGLDARRSFLVTAEGGGLVYRSFDHDRPQVIEQPDGVQRTTRATTTVAGGRESRAADGTTLFQFAAPNGYLYRIRVPAGLRPATVAVIREGRTEQVETLLGHTLSER